MEGEVVAEGLSFPEGPVWRGSELYFVDVGAGHVLRWTPNAGLRVLADTGGGPNGLVAGSDDAFLVTQNGGILNPNSSVQGCIQRISSSGGVTVSADVVDGHRLDAPNDLAFDPDGRLWFTDPRDGPESGDLRSGRLYAIDLLLGRGRLVAELGPVYPNGLAFTMNGDLIWTETLSRRVVALRSVGNEVIIELPERHIPDGMCIDRDDRLYVASTYAHCVTVVDRGKITEKLMCGDGMPTNCCFGAGNLYVTEARWGTIWRFNLDVEGATLYSGPTEEGVFGTSALRTGGV
jgi:gluconolactonase